MRKDAKLSFFFQIKCTPKSATFSHIIAQIIIILIPYYRYFVYYFFTQVLIENLKERRQTFLNAIKNFIN